MVTRKRNFPLHIQRAGDAASRKAAAIGGAILFAAVGSFGMAHADEPAGAAAITVTLPQATDARIVEETREAEGLELRALSAPARLITAAFPVERETPQSAEPFVISGDNVDKSLALRCLTQAVYFEASSEPIKGQRAVAQVVLNRMRHPAFPKSVCGVVYQGVESRTCQFSFVCDGKLARTPSLFAWREAELIARAALSGYVADDVGEATHYHADYVAPQWAPLLSRVAEIGQHIFYRWPGEWGNAGMFNGRYAGEPRDALTLRLAQSSGELPFVRAAIEAAKARAVQAMRQVQPQKEAVRLTPRPAHVQYHIATLLEPATGSSAPAQPALSAKSVDDRTVAMAQ